MTHLQDHRLTRLTRHFFDALFDLRFLSAEGSMSFTKLVIGVCAMFISFGLLMLRVYVAKYANLGAMTSAEPYRQAVLADHAFLIALPMWVLAVVTVLIGHALFPDETDFRVLMPLPIRRTLVFGAKLLALLMFTGLFAAFMQIALAPLAVLTLASPWAESSLVPALAAYLGASLAGSAWAILLVVAIHGLLLLLVPRAQVAAVSAGVRSAMLCALVLALPFVMRLPSLVTFSGGGAAWLAWLPPAWFVGLERALLGTAAGNLGRYAGLGLISYVAVSAVAIASYTVLYLHFDRLIVRASRASRIPHPASRIHASRIPHLASRMSPVWSFIVLTLRRSVLHQGIVIVLSAIGAGLVVNSLIGASPRAIGAWVIWAPHALMFVTARAVRMALLIPAEPRANWIFRMTETPVSRARHLAETANVVLLLGVVLPVALLFPVQWFVLGGAAPVVTVMALLMGCLYAELLMQSWARIPFTCSYLPGKGFVPQVMLARLAAFGFFTGFGSAFGAAARRQPSFAIVLGVILIGAVAILRRLRRRHAVEMPLEFEDALPSEINPLRLS